MEKKQPYVHGTWWWCTQPLITFTTDRTPPTITGRKPTYINTFTQETVGDCFPNLISPSGDSFNQRLSRPVSSLNCYNTALPIKEENAERNWTKAEIEVRKTNFRPDIYHPGPDHLKDHDVLHWRFVVNCWTLEYRDRNFKNCLTDETRKTGNKRHRHAGN